MKLIIAIIQTQDSYELIGALTKVGYAVTKLSSSGGFLKTENTTLLIGTHEEKVDKAVEIIRSVCASRQKIVSDTLPFGYTELNYPSRSVSVSLGGATIFVLDIDRFEKY